MITNVIIIAISLLVFFALLALFIIIRIKNNKFEVKPTEIVLAIIPIAIVLLLTGNLKKFEFGGLKIESAFIKASESAITDQIININYGKLPPWYGKPPSGMPSTLEEAKEVPSRLLKAVSRIPPPLRKAEALQFILGDGHYAGDRILYYLSSLYLHPSFKYIIIINKDGTFFGLADGQTFYNLFESGEYSVNEFAKWLNESNEDALKQMPSLKSAKYAVNEKTTDKSQALQKMESLNVDTLPVINNKGQFVGIVNRSRLTASLLIDVSQQLKNK